MSLDRCVGFAVAPTAPPPPLAWLTDPPPGLGRRGPGTARPLLLGAVAFSPCPRRGRVMLGHHRFSAQGPAPVLPSRAPASGSPAALIPRPDFSGVWHVPCRVWGEGAMVSVESRAAGEEGLLGGPRGWQLVFRREPWADAPEGATGPVERSEGDGSDGCRTPHVVSPRPGLGSLHPKGPFFAQLRETWSLSRWPLSGDRAGSIPSVVSSMSDGPDQSAWGPSALCPVPAGRGWTGWRPRRGAWGSRIPASSEETWPLQDCSVEPGWRSRGRKVPPFPPAPRTHRKSGPIFGEPASRQTPRSAPWG